MALCDESLSAALAIRPNPAIVPFNQEHIPPYQLVRRGTITGWYAGPQDSTIDVAREAYESATHLFSSTLSHEECRRIWLRDKSSMNDVQDAVNSARKVYEARSKNSTAKKWLRIFSTRVMYYGAIMDTLSQHHPEYVSLAWGTMKFLFVAVLNNEKLITEIAKTLTKTGDVLPRAELSTLLYPTDRMKKAVAYLYASILQFFEQATKWYKQGRFKHSIFSITKPYELGFQKIVDDISECSRNVDQLAAAASRAEIRDLHIQVCQLAEVAIATQTLQKEIHLDIKAEKQRFCAVQVSTVFAMFGHESAQEKMYRIFDTIRWDYNLER